jgi:hypothetical protein
MVKHHSILTVGLLASGLAACSSADGDGPGGGSSGAGNGASGAGNLGSSGSGNPSDPNGGFGNNGGLVVGEPPPGEVVECTSEVSRAEQISLDMLIMMDRSSSMVGFFGCCGDIWSPVGNALGNFVALPEAAGLGVGIQFFPLQNNSCDVNLYAAPAAPIALLPGNVKPVQDAILANYPGDGTVEIGLTPTEPALQGAIQQAQQWAQQSGHKVIVVLATDGEPTVCGSISVPGVAQVAQQGLMGTPSIQTYVIGIGNVQGLNDIAVAGGTNQAIIVPADPAIASQEFLRAMNDIRGNAQIPCELKIPAPPEGQILDFGKVNVQFSASGATSEILFVGDPSRCDPSNGGWHFDNGSAPSSIVLCPATCGVVETQVSAELGIGLGCAPRVPM